MSDYRLTAAPIIKQFLTYHEHIRGHSIATVDSYYYDLKLFIGWIHLQEQPKNPDALKDESITAEQLNAIQTSDIYAFWTRRWSTTTRPRAFRSHASENRCPHSSLKTRLKNSSIPFPANMSCVIVQSFYFS